MGRIRVPLRRRDLRADAAAGLVLGVESVPDGLAGGLLANVNPIFGLHAYMVGVFTGALFTGSAFMAVQATGAMAIVVADVGAVHDNDDPARALFTLSIVTGVVMLVAGFLKAGAVLRFVANAVMVGFITAVGVNIVLGQLDALTGYAADGGNRVAKAVDAIVHIGSWDWPTVAVGVATIALILLLERTPLGPLGMVVAIAVTSGVVALLDSEVPTLASVADIPSALPTPELPDLSVVPALIVPALSLAFIGLVQGAGVSAGFPNPDGTYPDPSRDFVGQGAANVAVGVFQGMPVGGSMSATALVTDAGARSRVANLIAGVVVALVILLFGSLVEQVAMPALAGLLILVGARTVKPAVVESVWRTGAAQAVTLTVTFVLTMLIPLQYAVLVGVGISMILYVIGRANRLTITRLEVTDAGVREVPTPGELPAGEVVVLQPYGSLFFASAAVFDEAVPAVTDASRGSVVVLRLRGVDELGSTLAKVLLRYAIALRAVGSKLMLVSVGRRARAQLAATGVMAVVGEDDVYEGGEWIGRTLRRACEDATAWVREQRDGSPPE